MTKMLDPFDLIPKRNARAASGLRMADLEHEEKGVQVSGLPEQTLSENPLNYDFDMCPVFLSDLEDTDSYSQARWRDPMTLAAMQAADPKLQALFEQAGFGKELSHQRLPAGHYAADTDRARHDVIIKLTQSLAGVDTSAMAWGQINRLDLFKANAEAMPVSTQPSDMETDRPIRADGKRKVALLVLIGGFMLIGFAAISML